MKETRLRLGSGEVKVPRGWTSLSERDLVKEAPPQAARLALNRALPPPRLQVSLLDLPGEGGDPEAALLAFFEALKARWPQVKLEERGVVAFDDGAPGAKLVLELEPLPGFRATQVHLARSDGGRVQHLLGSVPATAPRGGREEVLRVLASFRPSSGSV